MSNISMTPSGIGPATFRLVAQCVNQLYHRAFIQCIAVSSRLLPRLQGALEILAFGPQTGLMYYTIFTAYRSFWKFCEARREVIKAGCQSSNEAKLLQ